MKLIFTYMKKYVWAIVLVMVIKLAATTTELLIPYVLEHMIDDVAPTKSTWGIIIWGAVMLALALVTRTLNIIANRRSAVVARNTAYEVRRDLFFRTINLSGSQADVFGLPSLTSRMTSDSYNVQNFIRFIQSAGIRAPIMLIGGIILTITMDAGLALILCILTPIMLAVTILISRKGIPLYDTVQQCLDNVVRVMRENITGIRVVKALSKENYETERFSKENEKMTRAEQRSSIIMSLPSPLVTLALNVGLTLVVFIGARRVNAGSTQPGVILAFLTYFNMILMGVMGLSRLFIMMSKANASANRIAVVVREQEEIVPIPESEAASTDSNAFITFDHVTFAYGENSVGSEGFDGEDRQMSLSDINFEIKRGGSLGIIGPTGCGKTTIINLMMRFYDVTEGNIFIDGRDIRTYDKDELHDKFGTVFQNDVIFADTLEENISFGRELSQEELQAAAEDACASEFIDTYEDGFKHEAAIRGANLSGGQRQRVLISRALAGNPEILVLDDASSALDYRTDARLRKAVREHHSDTTTVIIAQRVSSILSLDEIIVMDDGRIIGKGTHEELLKTCPEYLEIYRTQMGEES